MFNIARGNAWNANTANTFGQRPYSNERSPPTGSVEFGLWPNRTRMDIWSWGVSPGYDGYRRWRQTVILSPLANKRLANGHVQHSQGQRPWNMNNNHKTFGQRPYSIAGRGPKFAAITITTVRAFDLQHQGSVSVFEGRYTRTGPRLPCDDAA